VTQGSGGPDQFGYRWVDSDDPFGPAYDWVDIAPTGAIAIASGDDVVTLPLPIGFAFPYYGADYTTVRVSSNGIVSFTDGSASYSNQPLPNPSAPRTMIAPFWDDLTVGSGDVYYQSDGSRFIVQWENVLHYGSGGPYTFQLILHRDGSIVFQYDSMGSPQTSATIGMQNATASDALQIAFNTTYVHDQLAVRIGELADVGDRKLVVYCESGRRAASAGPT